MKSAAPLTYIRYLAANSVLRNVVAMIVAKGLLVGLRLAVVFMTAKEMGPRDFGSLAFCFAVVEMVRILADFGTENYVLPKIATAQNIEEKADFLCRMIAFRIWSTALGFLVYVLVIALSSGVSLSLLSWITGCLLLTSMWTGTSLTYFQAQMQMTRPAALIGVVMLIALVAGVVLWPLGVTAQLILLLTTECVVAFVLFANVKSSVGLAFRPILAAMNPVLLCAIARQSWPLVSGAFMVVLYTRLDVFVVQNLLGSVAMGLYGFAYRVTEPFRFISNAIDSTLYSLMSRTDQIVRLRDHKFRRTLVMGVTSYATAFSVVSGLLGWALVTWQFSEFSGALPALLLLSLALGLRCLNGAMTALQYSLGRYTTIAKLAGANLVLTGLLIYPLNKWLGIVGCALLLCTVEGFNTLIQLRLTRSALGWEGMLPNRLAPKGR